MNYTQDAMINDFAARKNVPKSVAKDHLATVFDLINDAVKKELEVRIPGIGTLHVQNTKALDVHNLHGEGKIHVPAGKKLALRPKAIIQ